MNIFYRLVYGALITVSLASVAADAAMIPGYPDRVEELDLREVSMLPSYCKYTQMFRNRVPGGNNPAEIKHWYATFGKTFHAMHHYCVGLMKTNRALYLAKTPQIRNFYFKSAIQEFDYVIMHAEDDFVLLPEILTKKGDNLIRLGRAAIAITELERAIALKPNYWPPYTVLADYYKGVRDNKNARAVLEKGLAAVPDAKPLRERLARLNAPAAGVASDHQSGGKIPMSSTDETPSAAKTE